MTTFDDPTLHLSMCLSIYCRSLTAAQKVHLLTQDPEDKQAQCTFAKYEEYDD